MGFLAFLRPTCPIFFSSEKLPKLRGLVPSHGPDVLQFWGMLSLQLGIEGPGPD